MEVEVRQIISYDQSKTIIQFFFKKKFDLNEVIKCHKSKHSPDQIIQHIKKVFKKLILDMEYELMVTEKIKTLQLTQNCTSQMFDYLIKFSQILNQEQISDLAIYYRNRVSKLTVYQTDLICSDKRLSIYNAFINYAIDHDLFRFSLFKSKPSAYNIPANHMYENAMAIYPSEALELVYQFFSNALHNLNNSRFYSSNGNSEDTNPPSEEITSLTPNIQKQIRRDGRYTTPKYFGQMLQQNLKNLFLIGLYRIYKAAMRSSMKTSAGWHAFSYKYLLQLDMFDLTWKGVLMRIAIYDDATMPEQIYISKHICKKFIKSKQNSIIKSPLEMGVKGGVTATGISFGKQSRVDREIKRKRAFMMMKIKQEMTKIIQSSIAYPTKKQYDASKFISLIDQ